jgi:NADPH:quinone reductase-like Zn-dependent oxidoreductase
MGLRGSMGNWGPEVFEMREMLNPVDAKVRQAGSWAVQPPDIIGYDVSGVIETIGEGVVDFVVGNVSSRTCYYSPDSQKA